MLDILFKRYKSSRVQYANFYEKELFDSRHKPFNLLQIGMDTSIPVWHKYLEKSNIYCIDDFSRSEPNLYDFKDNPRTYWARCNIHDSTSVNDIFKNLWNKPRFDIIIDNINISAHSRYNFLKKHCIGKYYIEENEKVGIY